VPAILTSSQPALRDDRFVVTLDRGFGDVRRYPPGTHAGLAVLRVDSQDARTVAEALTTFLGNHALGDRGLRRRRSRPSRSHPAPGLRTAAGIKKFLLMLGGPGLSCSNRTAVVLGEPLTLQ